MSGETGDVETTPNPRAMVYSAAAMYGGGAFVGLVEPLIPGGGPSASFLIAPGLTGLVVVALLLAFGGRLPRRAIAALGPFGAAVIAYTFAATQGSGDLALLYMWPVLWTATFFGRKATMLIVCWVGVVQAVALISLPTALGYPDRWLDVMVSVSIVAVVVRMLASRNEELHRQLAGEARIDPLTGLLNRRGFEERASLELTRAQREGYTVAVATFDVDYFKHINDEWGHQTGDLVLEHLGRVLRGQSRDVDIVARLGGEEFVALLPHCDEDKADSFTQRVRRALAVLDDSTLPTVRVSAGVASAFAPADALVLLQRADSALYAAKHAGRDRTVVSDRPALVDLADHEARSRTTPSARAC
jgi:diguanylate cyclase (GGDEF)-like protein